MDFHIHLHHHRDPELYMRLGCIQDSLETLTQEIQDMAGELASLQDQVTANSSVIDSALTLISGLAQKIQDLIDAGADPAQLQALVDELKAKDEQLAAAVAANTPSNPGNGGGNV